MEKYSRNLDRSILTRNSIKHYINKHLTYDSLGISMFDGTEAPKTQINRSQAFKI